MHLHQTTRGLALAAVAAVAALTGCGESAQRGQAPVDRFVYPTGLALLPRASGGPALLVASGNLDLRFDPRTGGSLIAVDPAASLGADGGAFTALAAMSIGSYSGPLAVAEPAGCPGLPGAMGLVTSRYTSELFVVPFDAAAAIGPCGADGCAVPLQPLLRDPYAVGLACRADGTRRTAYVSYLGAPQIGNRAAGTAWLTAIDLDAPGGAQADLPLGPGIVLDMAYDDATDRLYAVAASAGLRAPIYVASLEPCAPGSSGCRAPVVSTIDLFSDFRGADLQAIALSNPRPGAVRRAYVTARVYDVDLAVLNGIRPSGDYLGVLLVLELQDDFTGAPSARIVNAVDVGLHPGAVRVLPARAGQRDLVVVSASAGGQLSVYDDELGAVVAITALDPATGAPEAGRLPSALAVQPNGDTAYVWVAAIDDSTVSRLDVPLASPGLSQLATRADGSTAHIGRKRQ